MTLFGNANAAGGCDIVPEDLPRTTEAPIAVDKDVLTMRSYEGYDESGGLMAAGDGDRVTVTNTSDSPIALLFTINDEAHADTRQGFSLAVMGTEVSWSEDGGIVRRTITVNVQPGQSVAQDVTYVLTDEVNPSGEGSEKTVETATLEIDVLNREGDVMFHDAVELQADVTDINPPD